MTSLVEYRAAARVTVHDRLSVPVRVHASDGASHVDTVARVMDRVEEVGSLTGSGSTYVQRKAKTAEVLFFMADHVPVRGQVVVVSAGEAYRIQTIEPPDGLSVTAATSRLSTTDAAAFSAPA